MWLVFELVGHAMDLRSQRPENIPPPVEPVGILTGVRIRPILAGVIVDYVSTAVLGTAYLIAFSMKGGLENGDRSEETINKFLASPENLIILGIIGILCTILGGYVAGRLAEDIEVKHGTLVGLASLVLVTLQQSLFGESTPFPQWYEVVGYLVTVPAAALGGYLAQRQRELRATNHPTEG